MLQVKALLFTLGALLFTVALASPTLADVKAAVTDVIDGDTIRVVLVVRVRGVDTPEMMGKCPRERAGARQARAFTALAVGTAVRLKRLSAGRYNRLVAEVETENGDLATLLIEAGLGREYSGGKREGWC